MDAVQKRPDESETAFELRRGALANQLDELERLMVEAADLKAWITVDQSKALAQLNFKCTAIDDTSLATAIDEFNQHPDAFAAIKSLEESVFSGRLNHPIDAMRQENILSFLDLLGKDVDARVAASEKLSDSEQEATKKLFHGVSDLIGEGVKTGVVNAFTESKPDGNGDFVTVGAISAPGAAKLVEILPHLADARDGNSVDLNIETVGDVAIHKVRLTKGFVDLIDTFFGEERDLYIGTAENHVWLASGDGAMELLKDVIGQMKEPESNDVTLTASASLLPWMTRLKEIADGRPQPEDIEARQAWRDDLRRMGDAVEAMASDDSWSFQVTSDNDAVSGVMEFDTGLLRFAGKQVSAFTKENLSE